MLVCARGVADGTAAARGIWTLSSVRFAIRAKFRGQSSILKAVHETASDLRRLGLIDKRRMDRYDALCFAPTTERRGGASKVSASTARKR